MKLLSPAKLNLMLHITGRRADGYHHLQTLFQLLDYGDTLEFEANDSGAITLAPALPGVPESANLIVRAAKLLQQSQPSAARLGAHIKLAKIMPMGGGIGGGSSNAATTLLALNELWGCQLGLEQLAVIGLQLGADVPVFVKGQSAWAEGVGERLQAIDIPDTWYLVIKPDCEISTAEIFSHKQLTRDTVPITIAAVFEQGNRNDCEPVVRALYPQVDAALTWLNGHIVNRPPARLTGTGACVFASFPDQHSAQQILHHLPSELQGFVAKGVNRSPTHQALGLC